MKSPFLNLSERFPGRTRTIAAALLTASAIVACDADSPASSSQNSADTDSKPSRSASAERESLERSGEQLEAAHLAGAQDNEAISRFAMIESAAAEIGSAQDQSVQGSFTFTPEPENPTMRVSVSLQGLEPGPHGIHIHDSGTCWEGDKLTPGSHFNPFETRHGAPDDAEHHVGDMGNVNADSDGRVHSEFSLDHLVFSGPASILQRVVVVHSGEDDLSSQPSGNAGTPVACGIIFQEKEVLAGPDGESA